MDYKISSMNILIYTNVPILFNFNRSYTNSLNLLQTKNSLKMKKYADLFKGKKKQFNFPLEQKKHTIYDNNGKAIVVADSANPIGFVSVSVGIPSVYGNMCGWFWDIKSEVNAFGIPDTTGTKMWVVVKDNKIRIYDTPFNMRLLKSIDPDCVIDMDETKYQGLEIDMDGVRIELEIDDPLSKAVGGNGKKTAELTWAWGDDGSKTKGLWRRALISHNHAPSLLKEAEKIGFSTKNVRAMP